MGGGNYSQDVARGARSAENEAFRAYSVQDSSGSTRRAVHPALDPFKKAREVNNATPIVVALDVTRSRGDDTKLMYEKLPMLMGQIELHGYVENPGISFAAVGDANSDSAPLQVGQFEGDNRLDEVLSRMWIEEGGGGTGQESYELAAYFYSRTNCVRLAAGTGKKGYFFFVGDEGFYPKLDRGHVKRIIGDELSEDWDSARAFAKLQEKFEVFLIFPAKSLADRKADIDAEIRQRVTAAGGQYDGVDVRASLVWNNRNDLDLHMLAPSGEEIFYGNKKSRCGGWLDVDMNVGGDTTKPVENVRWAKGQAPKGRYKVFVRNYRFHEQTAPTKFRVEIEMGGEIQHFDGEVSPNGETGPQSDVHILTFDYDPARRRLQKEEKEEKAKDDPYAQYSDDVVLKQWGEVMPKGNILRIEDPKAIIDVLMGALAIREGRRDLDAFLKDLKERDNTQVRIDQVASALRGLTSRHMGGTVEGEVPAGGGAQKRSKRL